MSLFSDDALKFDPQRKVSRFNRPGDQRTPAEELQDHFTLSSLFIHLRLFSGGGGFYVKKINHDTNMKIIANQTETEKSRTEWGLKR